VPNPSGWTFAAVTWTPKKNQDTIVERFQAVLGHSAGALVKTFAAEKEVLCKGEAEGAATDNYYIERPTGLRFGEGIANVISREDIITSLMVPCSSGSQWQLRRRSQICCRRPRMPTRKKRPALRWHRLRVQQLPPYPPEAGVLGWQWRVDVFAQAAPAVSSSGRKRTTRHGS
jgi:hypothetical protein